MSNNDTPVAFVKRWILQQTRLVLPPTWNGGWERWAQGQIAMLMEGQDGYQVWTEQNIYLDHPNYAVDLEFRKPPGVRGVRKFLELKCYSEVNNDTAYQFITRVLQDFDKVTKLKLTRGVPNEPDAKGSTLWVIGISQKQFRDAITRAGLGEVNWLRFRREEAVSSGGSGDRGTFDIWYYSYVNDK
ncbi:hypothetical protein MAA_06220 [Metarhizium robertsii ARSEF 23]|uniref:Uncharacterized protein n=1 Tax=Metarhizium robertsii (strain ARSEF 23 / ATCC MYA-3075) TaxID=655844 RepID=E9F222_METRA|nr:uncharacterized protein MAA_06220 [Metarhizium robertsii ARSEF 23]EFY98111.1 hypothetical protein MAA_06220 [Metarhizium robertsii ARSEF 23]